LLSLRVGPSVGLTTNLTTIGSARVSPGGAALRDGHLPCLRIGGRTRIPTRAVEAYVVHLVLE